MAEKEYIESKKFLTKVRYICKAYGLSNFIIEKLKKAMGDSTAADVVEVRHGEWVPSPHHYGLYMCSECQCPDEKCQPIFDKRNAWKSCPNCGAKMDRKMDMVMDNDNL